LAIEGMWEYPEPELIPILSAAADADGDEEVRCAAIRTLGRYVFEGDMAAYDCDFGDLDDLVREDELPREDFETVRAFLCVVYGDSNKSLNERRFAVEALSFLNDEEVHAVILEAYAHPERDMKRSALFAMGRNGNGRWTDILQQEIYSADPELQWEAIRAAGEASLEEAGKDLWRMTYADDREIQLMAIWALGQSGWDGAFDRLEELALSSTDEEVRDTAEAAIEEWDLARLLKDHQATGEAELDFEGF
jgi:hypothetical protein